MVSVLFIGALGLESRGVSSWFNVSSISFHFSSASNRIINARDHASIQINLAEVDAQGVMTDKYKTYAICGSIRQMVS